MKTIIQNKIGEVHNNSTGLTDHQLKTKRFLNLHGPGRWICNKKLIKDQDCAYRIKDFRSFLKTKKHDYGRVFTWWEMGKCKLKEIIKDCGRENVSLLNGKENVYINAMMIWSRTQLI